MPGVGPYSELPGHVVRSGLSGRVIRDGLTLSHVTQVEYTAAVGQVPIRFAGDYREKTKPGVETRSGTFGYHDVDDAFALQVWRFMEARRRGDRSAAFFPEFEMVCKQDDIGAFDISEWQLDECQLFQLDGGFNTGNESQARTTPFTYGHETPLHAYELTPSGIVITEEPGG